jgi:hypothetical protein
MNYSIQQPKLVTHYFGEWWEIANPHKKFIGNLLIFSNGNYTLETIGKIIKNNSDISASKDNYIDIQGVAIHSETKTYYYIKLIHCFYAGRSFSSVNLKYYKTHVSYFLKTRVHETAVLDNFNRMIISILNLDVWIDDRSLEFEDLDQGYKLIFTGPKSQEVFRSNLFKINIGNGYKYQYPDPSGFHFKYLPSFEVIYCNSVTELATREVATKLNWLLSLSCFSPTHITSYDLNNSNTNPNGYLTSLIYHDKFVDTSYKTLHRHDLILTLEDLKSNPKLLANWFDFTEKNPLITQNFFAVLRNSTDFIHNRFLNLINGILTFAEQILFKRKMKNEDSLYQLFKCYNDCWSSFYNPTKSTTDEIIARRHLLVHNSKHINQSLKKDDNFRLVWFTTQLQFVSLSIFLRELGLSDIEIRNRLERKSFGRPAFNEENL